MAKFASKPAETAAADAGLSDEEIDAIQGTGQGGAITKGDLNAYLEARGDDQEAPADPGVPAPYPDAVEPADPTAPTEPYAVDERPEPEPEFSAGELTKRVTRRVEGWREVIEAGTHVDDVDPPFGDEELERFERLGIIAE